MKLVQQLQTQLDQFDAEQLATPGVLEASNETGCLRFHLDRCEKIACSVREIRMEAARLEELDAADLQSLGEKLVSRMDYLLEPLAIVEADAACNSVQIRSARPQSDGQERQYYELLLQPGLMTFCRYTKPSDETRQPTTAMLTREVVLRVARDLEDALLDAA